MSNKKLDEMWLGLLRTSKVMSAQIRANDEYGDSTEGCDEVDRHIARIEKELAKKTAVMVLDSTANKTFKNALLAV